MENQKGKSRNDRRLFLGNLASSAAAIGIATFGVSLPAEASPDQQQDVETWFDKIKGKHKMVFDVTKPHHIFPFAWPRVFLNSNIATGTPEKDCSVVVVLRHEAIAYAFQDSLWEKYKFGELFQAPDPATKTAAVRNPFSNPKDGEYKVPGVGAIAIGIAQLQASGVMFCVCNTAITKASAVLGASTSADPAEVRKELMAGMLPGIQPVPSGVWALGRAQERGCAYCFAS